jgi:hypothetical protein
MARREPRALEGEPVVKTTIELPESMWKAVKVRAAQEGSDLRHVIMDALKVHLGLKKKGRKK